MVRLIQWLFAFGIKTLSWLVGYLPTSVLQVLGKYLGLFLYHIVPSYRKKTLSNLALCPLIDITSVEQLQKKAQAVFCELGMVVFDYFKMSKVKDPSSLAYAIGREPILKLFQSGQPIIFFNGHQSNWEIGFLEGCRFFKGFAIAKPQKNPFLYEWIVKTRERFGGKIVASHNASLKAFKALKRGECVGLVGDQADLKHGSEVNFLGRKAWSSPLAASLAYKTGAPIVLVTTARKGHQYEIRYHPPLWANHQMSEGSEIERLNQELTTLFEKTILEHPEQWLWIHQRWKPKTAAPIRHCYRYDAILIIVDELKGPSYNLALELQEIYKPAFISIIPAGFIIEGTKAYCYKLGINLSSDPHALAPYTKKSLLKTIHIPAQKDQDQHLWHQILGTPYGSPLLSPL